ncbi:pyruvate dehydrogenase (acetyl-transferring), homodimeric type [Rhodohalobacter sp. 8-1]|uniref:pyruvate dehydrogenase (acetyl-transferring), homodimeric type n=1 Tax=Rhodohalobacter sp. 8-1 TaxID=3131972 RepID=UPI0030EB493D
MDKSSKEIENREWINSLRWILNNRPGKRAKELLTLLNQEAEKYGVSPPDSINTPYVNTIPPTEEIEYPGDPEIEKKLTALIRWNAMAMVVRANKKLEGIGGHISTHGSIADLFEVGFNHFFKVSENGIPDIVYFQGHASPGVYSRAFLEGRLSEKDLENFRRELADDGGLPSYPHPHLMKDFWNNPTVSMGLAPLTSIYQARFNKYLQKRGLIEQEPPHVWGFFGDGEMDEPESIGNLAVAANEKLDNLTFVIDCNLQRLDGPVRGNQKVIQELEAQFKGAGWNVIKVLWGSDWDPLFEKDGEGLLVDELTNLPDGQLQKYAYAEGDLIREDLFGRDEKLKKLAEPYSDDELKLLKRGGHDPQKIYNAYKAALEHEGQPTVILAQTIKGYGQGDAGEASNVAHQQKKLDSDALKHFRDFFDVPVSDDDIEDVPFLNPGDESGEIKYLRDRRENLGGYLPERKDRTEPLENPDPSIFEDYFEGSGDDEAATTMVMIQILGKLLQDEKVGDHIVPIIPDESRTFGMESLFRQVGIYAPEGQQYDPVDEDSLMYYREEEHGAILEEGITEAGCMGSFIAAGTAYSHLGINMIPFFFFYSMFGFQRIGDFAWAAADAGAKGFYIGGVSGRTSLSGEGLQHLDGQSHLYAFAFPKLRAYDPAFAYELAVIVQNGIEEMYVNKKDLSYYITVTNQVYSMPPKPDKPENIDEYIIKGMYRFNESEMENDDLKAHLFGSGAIMQEVLKAAEILEGNYTVSTDTWSITSYKAMYDNAIDTEQENRVTGNLNRKRTNIEIALDGTDGVFVMASDYVKSVPLSVAKWFPEPVSVLGTDGFGRSESVEELRRFFEVDANHIAYAALFELTKKGDISKEKLSEAAGDLGISPDKLNPRTS